MSKRTILLLIFCIGWITVVYAQDTNEFQRIAKRIMDAYDVGEELEHAPDSANFYGGVYLGAGTNGRVMPSGYVTYLKDRLLLTSQLSIDISELSTEKEVNTDFLSNANQLTSTDILTKYEKVDFSTRLGYAIKNGQILTFGVLESFDNNRVSESSIKNGQEADGTKQESRYEEQHRSNRDLKLGGLLQYINDINKTHTPCSGSNLKKWEGSSSALRRNMLLRTCASATRKQSSTSTPTPL